MRQTMREFRAQRPEYDSEFEYLKEHGYEFEDADRVEIAKEGRENGGHLLLRGPGYSIQFSQAEPIVSDETS